MDSFDRKYLSDCVTLIGGADEAGRGPLAGPVCVCICVMPLAKASIVAGVNDSKQLSEKTRERLAPIIKEKAVDYKIEFADVEEIEEKNILGATKAAFLRAYNKLQVKPRILLTDYIEFGVPITSSVTVPITHGDAISYNIACASILAKTARDALMAEYDKQYPLYGFARHKGYGTAAHIAALKQYGACGIHRPSFIKKFVQ